MNTKVQKIKIEYAKFRTNGFILDFLVKSLGIEQKDEKLQRVYQRFIKEEDISSQEYHDTLNIIIEDILYVFFENRDDSVYKYFEDLIKQFFKYNNYIKVQNETLATSQKELDFIIIMNIIIPFINLLELSTSKKISIIELIPDKKTSVQKLFNILSHSVDGNIKELLNNILECNKTTAYDGIKKDINNWLDGKSRPNNEHIKLISQLSEFTNKFTYNELKIYLQISKIIQYLYDKTINYFTDIQTKQLIKYFEFCPNLNIHKYFLDTTNKKVFKDQFDVQIKSISNIEFKTYSILLAPIYIATLPSDGKIKENEDKLTIDLKTFEDKYYIENNPYYSFLKARYYAQKRDYKEATKYYLIALEYGKNCMGIHIQSIIKEGLFVSAQDTRKNQVDLINAKSNFTKFYKEAYFYKLIDDLPDEISIYFLNDMKKQFDIYFKNLFENNVKVKNTKFTNITPNFAIGLTKDIKNIKIDYTKPDKLIKDTYPNPMPQLIHCASVGNYDCVKKLVENGADVNLLKKSDNASALLLSFPEYIIYPFNKDFKNIVKFLIPKMSKNTLNTRLIKQKETALSYAMEYGLVNIVKLLIKYGIDLNQRVTISEYSPLYMSIKYIRYSKNGINNKNSKFKTIPSYESLKERKILAKVNKFLNGVFDEERDKDLELKTKDEKGFSEVIKSMIIKEYKKRKNEYYEIFYLIVNELDNVDIPQESTQSDFTMTPLVFATELNEVELVKSLLDKGANIDYYTTEGARAYDYAVQNNNKELMELLE